MLVLLELVTFGSVAPAAMLSSGCGALELRERKNERADGGAVRESSRDGERLSILLKGKKVFRWGLKIFRGIFVFSENPLYNVTNTFSSLIIFLIKNICLDTYITPYLPSCDFSDGQHSPSDMAHGLKLNFVQCCL